MNVEADEAAKKKEKKEKEEKEEKQGEWREEGERRMNCARGDGDVTVRQCLMSACARHQTHPPPLSLSLFLLLSAPSGRSCGCVGVWVCMFAQLVCVCVCVCVFEPDVASRIDSPWPALAASRRVIIIIVSLF